MQITKPSNLKFLAFFYFFLLGVTLHAQESAVSVPETQSSSLKLELNLPGMLLNVMKDGELIKKFPVAIGQSKYRTPQGNYSIKRLEWNPTWYPPKSEWAKDATITPPGPKNPLGPVKMIIDGDLRIHGTNKASSIGHAASHGCIRMKNEDAKELAWLIQQNHSDSIDESLFEKYGKNRGRTYVVPLKAEVPVVFSYEPILVTKEKIIIYPDPYGKIGKLKDVLMEKLIFSNVDLSKIDEEKIKLLKKPIKEKMEINIEELMLSNQSVSSPQSNLAIGFTHY